MACLVGPCFIPFAQTAFIMKTNRDDESTFTPNRIPFTPSVCIQKVSSGFVVGVLIIYLINYSAFHYIPSSATILTLYQIIPSPCDCDVKLSPTQLPICLLNTYQSINGIIIMCFCQKITRSAPPDWRVTHFLSHYLCHPSTHPLTHH